MTPLKLSRQADMVVLPVRVVAGAPRNQVVGVLADALKVRIAAPPAQGRANRELIKFLAGILGLSRPHVRLLKGPRSHLKFLGIRGLTGEEVIRLLTQHFV